MTIDDPEKTMATIKPETLPGEASAEGGYVLLDGPGGVAIAMTVDCADETGRRLIAAAAAAREQPQRDE